MITQLLLTILTLTAFSAVYFMYAGRRDRRKALVLEDKIAENEKLVSVLREKNLKLKSSGILCGFVANSADFTDRLINNLDKEIDELKREVRLLRA